MNNIDSFGIHRINHALKLSPLRGLRVGGVDAETNKKVSVETNHKITRKKIYLLTMTLNNVLVLQ